MNRIGLADRHDSGGVLARILVIEVADVSCRSEAESVITGPQPVMVVGGTERVALHDLGILCMEARLTPDLPFSVLQAEELTSVKLDGVPAVRFRVFPLVGDARTFLVAEAPLSPAPRQSGRIVVRTELTLADETWTVDAELVPRTLGSPAIQLGLKALRGRFEVRPQLRHVAGPPR